jgi:hypothetical protein
MDLIYLAGILILCALTAGLAFICSKLEVTK